MRFRVIRVKAETFIVGLVAPGHPAAFGSLRLPDVDPATSTPAVLRMLSRPCHHPTAVESSHQAGAGEIDVAKHRGQNVCARFTRTFLAGCDIGGRNWRRKDRQPVSGVADVAGVVPFQQSPAHRQVLAWILPAGAIVSRKLMIFYLTRKS